MSKAKELPEYERPITQYLYIIYLFTHTALSYSLQYVATALCLFISTVHSTKYRDV